MLPADMIEQIKSLIQPVLEQEAAELVDLVYRLESGRNVLRLLVDKPKGVTLDDCARINKAIGNALDNSGLITQSFVIEVNSPGLDRLLTKRGDFDKKIGENLKLTIKNSAGATDTVIAQLKSVTDSAIIIVVKDSERSILFTDIIKAKAEIKP
ncbi:MAG: hypothetical protein COW11_02925 [Candidatus Omnitrophica bacterium CG12_big_fil_rev_8_21_14_0_65_43_15]|uniref:Ribosome maturation factor RimP n=1 Tax=Candidatus Taenaricola geysiri TaxID=1974752 RepID=A0A2J0LF71_9BACT|nr:MAG: hypothetical protein COS48_00025 [Candidatus Omnitrophica bacterium CG03_land_8_20_14_0_80_43_22]PIW66498.1 MAG: hypothetical protein COW11_02925 [Candidatus Omnitrophica bacterium CG12_big_fil_rev_8_21_14_0_65_43_15]